MPKFITIGYGDQAGYDKTVPRLRDAAHANDRKLLDAGALIGIAGRPAQVRNHEDAGTRVEDGPFMSSALPVAGFAVIDAADLSEAIELVSKSPCAVAYGVIEVWPLELPPQ